MRQNRDTPIHSVRWLYRRGNIFLLPPVFLSKIVRCKVKGKQLRFQAALQTKFFKIERRTTMITYYNHTHMTAVPTRLLLDTNLSAEAKLTGALLYTFEDGRSECSGTCKCSEPPA